MSKRHADSTPDEKAPKRRKLSDSVLVEAARNGDTTAVRVGLEKLSPDTDSKTVSFDAVHEACRGNHDECLALLLPYVETTQMGFGMLLSECIHADHTACTEVLLQHWKSVCSNVAFVPHGQEADIESKTPRPCPAMWADPAVCQVLIDAGADIETKDEKGCVPLLRASISGKIAVVKMLVEAGAGVRVTDNERVTCLILASFFGHTETVRYLVGLKDVDVNHAENNGLTALHCAVKEGLRAVVEVLIDAGADIETKDTQGFSPLHTASIFGKLGTVNVLIEAGADVRATDNEGQTCLMLASGVGHIDTVRYLVSLKDVEVNHHEHNSGFTALHFAVKEGHGDVVQVLIDAGADVQTKPVMLASSSGYLDIVKMLVEAGAGVRVTDNEGVTCLILASGAGHTETVRYLVGLKDMDVNHVWDVAGHTALGIAVTKGYHDVVEVLIDAGADIEAKSKDSGRSPLLFASSLGHLVIVKILVEAGAGVRVTVDEGDTCLILAAYFGHTETVRYLVGLKDVDVNHQGMNNQSALHSAVQEGHPDVVRVLIDAGASVNTKDRNGAPPLHCACRLGHLDIVKMLVEAGAGVCTTDSNGQSCLMPASGAGHTETVRYLVGLKDVEVNHKKNNGVTALHCAVQKGHVDVVQVLIDAGADIDAKNEVGRSPLMFASIKGHLDVVKVLVEAGAGVRATNNDGDTCLLIAANFGHTETVRYLVGLKDVDVNHQGTYNHTALHSAVDEGHPDVVQVLIDAGASVKTKDQDGRSPLHCASRLGHLDIVKMLIDAGAEVCATDNKVQTCLILAAYHGHTDTVRYLVGLKDVDVNHAENNGLTALDYAVRSNHPDVVQLLIHAGADIEAKDTDGLSPLLLASTLGHLDIVKMLVEAGAGTDKERETCCMLASHVGHTETMRYLEAT